MRHHALLLCLLLLCLSWVLCVQSQVPITSFDPKFIGYYVAPNSIEPLVARSSWITSGLYAGDCSSSGRCPLATGCSNGVVYYDNSASMSCTGAFTCVSLTIFAKSPNVLPSAHNYGCRMGWSAFTVYRELPATTTSSSSLTMSTVVPASSTLAPTPSSTSVLVTATATATNVPLTRESSKTWIAGAVIGPIVIIVALIGAVLFWRKRRNTRELDDRHKYAQELGAGDSLGQEHLMEKYAREARAAELAHPQELSELPAQQPLYEMSTQQQQHYELSGSR